MRIHLLLALVLVMLATTAATAAYDDGIKSPVVRKLAQLLKVDTQLAESVRYTLAHVPSKDWGTRGRNLTALLNFFDAWANAPVVPQSDKPSDLVPRPLAATPHYFPRPLASVTPTPLSFISPMWSLASETRDSAWLRDATLLQWLTEFMKERGAFMD